MEASIISIAADEEAKSAGIEANLPSILRWMGRRNDNWLIIFDGADVGYEVVEGFIPPGKHGNILISSRNTAMNRLASPSSAHMEVVKLDEDAAVELFTKSAKLASLSPAEQSHAEAIIRELCCLALAVDQAASSIATGICRIDEYLSLYKRRSLQLVNDRVFKGSSKYRRAVYTTWEFSFGELQHRASSSSPDSVLYEAAILILRIFSFFHSDGIREDIFRRAAEAINEGSHLFEVDPNSPLSHLLERSESDMWDSFNFRQTIRILTQFSLIHVDDSSVFSMHRLIHEWIQVQLPNSSRSEMALLAATILTQSEGYGQSAEDHAHCQTLLVHLITLSSHLERAGLMGKLSVNIMQRMAQIYRQGGKSADAEALVCHAISLIRKDTSKATAPYINILFQLASVLRDSGRLREAESLQRWVLEWRQNHLGTNHVSTVVARNHLADNLHNLGKFVEAKELEIQVLDWQKEHLGMDHQDTYIAMANLAATFCHLGEFVEAKELEIQVLDWWKEHLGMDHPDTYRAMANLAVTLYNLDELSEAKGLEEQVLDWHKMHLGLEHPDTSWVMKNLAYTLRKLGEISEAEELFAQVMELDGTMDASSTSTL
jgi:tetratricopeptide (TPR) repeat protein